MNEWYDNWTRECKECGNERHYPKSFISDFFQERPCKKCGEYCGDWIKSSVTRYVYTGILWKPWTWLSGYTEVKLERNENPDDVNHDPFMSFYHE